MKRLLSAWLILTILFSFATGLGAMAADKLFVATLEYDGAKHDYTGTYFDITVNGAAIQTPIPPIVLANGRSIVPVREIFEAVGANVYWTEGSPSRVVIANADTTVSLALGSDIALVNGKEVKMEVAAKLVAYDGIGKTMVPIRFVAETLDMQVDYSEEKALIAISNQASNEQPTPDGELVLQHVQSYSDNDVLTVEFRFGAQIESYNSMALENPNRIVVDVTGAKLGTWQYSYPLTGNVSQIRFGEHDTYLRIVFDAAQLPKRRVTLSEDKRTLKVLLSTSELPPEEEKAPVPEVEGA
ncbi:MAG: AMIN domain-containing protein, partial [Clostridia bacterium]|nr:AMIN domain-containing protein [Clostridia bacterium]